VSVLIHREPRPGGLILQSQALFDGIFLETVD
jgi:hypothetical protein